MTLKPGHKFPLNFAVCTVDERSEMCSHLSTNRVKNSNPLLPSFRSINHSAVPHFSAMSASRIATLRIKPIFHTPTTPYLNRRSNPWQHRKAPLSLLTMCCCCVHKLAASRTLNNRYLPPYSRIWWCATTTITAITTQWHRESQRNAENRE